MLKNSLGSSQLLRTRAAADHCGLSPSNLNKRRVYGLPPAFIKVGRVVLYDPADLEDWLRSCRRQSTSQK